MSLLSILRYPDSRLTKTAEAVTVFDDELKKLVADMAQTMYRAPGIGLAAPQVDISKQIVVIDISESRTDLRVLINPKITKTSSARKVATEGCLSVPGYYEELERFAEVTVRAQDENGKSFVMHAKDLMAVCVQHELDHLKGFMFVDYLSPLKRNRIKTKMQKEDRANKKS